MHQCYPTHSNSFDLIDARSSHNALLIITTDSKLTMKSAAVSVRARRMLLLWALNAALFRKNRQHFCLAFPALPSPSFVAYHHFHYSERRTRMQPQKSCNVCDDAQRRIKRTHPRIQSASFRCSAELVPYGRRRSSLRMQNDNDDSNYDRGVLQTAAVTAGLVAQPIVWASLYSVATTGAGLPAGPGGLLGALVGVSYLVIVGWVAGASVVRRVPSTVSERNASTAAAVAAEALSWVSLLAGLVVLARLVADQGCIPNAQPILDYSNYLPVCRSSE